MPGTVVTFYSYKGGVGRSFALANVAVQLGNWGYRVLCVDWDLDAPGLSYYFGEWVSKSEVGLVDLMSAFAAGSTPDYRAYVQRVSKYPAGGRIDLISAGAQGRAYPTMAQSIEWARLYDTKDLGAFLETLRASWVQEYDFVLIDSRTGVTDIGGICTAQLPDILIMLFTSNEQSLAGTLDVARRAQEARDKLPYDRSPLLIVPAPSRIDTREEYRIAQYWRERFATDLAGLFGPWLSRDADVAKLLAHITIPYVGFWSFGEQIAIRHETDPTPDQISYSLRALSALIAHRLDRTDLLSRSRDSYVTSAETAAKETRFRYDIFFSYDSRSSKADLIAQQLIADGLKVYLDDSAQSVGQKWPRSSTEALEGSHHMVVLFGPTFSTHQLDDVEYFFRQTLDQRTNGLVIPLLAFTSRLPSDAPRGLQRTQAIPITGRPSSVVAQEIMEAISDNP